MLMDLMPPDKAGIPGPKQGALVLRRYDMKIIFWRVGVLFCSVLLIMFAYQQFM